MRTAGAGAARREAHGSPDVPVTGRPPAGGHLHPAAAAGRLRGNTLPKALVSCSYPLAQVREMIAAGHLRRTRRSGVAIPRAAGHWPMFSRPEDLARLLDRIAAAQWGHA
ncbi:hypothetical protein LI90_1405 [Carbonactinospora thermoautotrophica]|uniref:Alpha/beta hydrolase n=1 Tax=Carbonactinospora thermoautotrophica TaxID=1469144 RepID=A0A132MPH4_9ACTN|nr:hypothetical protein [Carbonactinospora thermoautotrophica]KWW99766.1 hypothetical protein LI90_1405 [Carbonactinospora thermoautotrophica]